MKKKKRTSDGVTRRQFLQSVGAGIGAATFGQLGVVEAALLPKGATSEKHDVIVIGTGLSGMTAALMAKLQGADVAILEKMPKDRAGGNSVLAGGMIAAPADASQKARDEYYDDFIKKGMGKANPVFTRVLADQSLETIEWIKAQGVDLMAPIPVAGYRVKAVIFAPGLYQGVPRGLAKVADVFKAKGGTIAYETKAKQLIMDSKGSVVGVRAMTSSGLKDFMGKAVIIATGGYAANKQLLEQWVDPDADDMMLRGVPWGTGDGLMMAQEAGAELINFGGMQSVHVAAVSPKNTSAGNPFTAVAYTLAINKAGKRYVDESLGYVTNGKATMRQPGQTIALVFDEEIKKQSGVGMAMKQFQNLGIPIIEASSLDELAERIRVPPDAFKRTIADFNAAVQGGKALTVNPPKAAWAFPVAAPTFYAFYPMVPGIAITFGGIRTNTNAQALEADGRIIPGLYAAGEGAGGLFYEDYVAGGSIANCVVMGRIAGKQAAAYARPAKK
jgi:flavocytochrome c